MALGHGWQLGPGSASLGNTQGFLTQVRAIDSASWPGLAQQDRDEGWVEVGRIHSIFPLSLSFLTPTLSTCVYACIYACVCACVRAWVCVYVCVIHVSVHVYRATCGRRRCSLR